MTSAVSPVFATQCAVPGEISTLSPAPIGNFSAPIGGIYGNITKTHDYNSDQMLNYIKASFSCDVDLVSFQLHQEKEDHISLNWHLTRSEKKYICKALYDPYFRRELSRLQILLDASNSYP